MKTKMPVFCDSFGFVGFIDIELKSDVIYVPFLESGNIWGDVCPTFGQFKLTKRKMLDGSFGLDAGDTDPNLIRRMPTFQSPHIVIEYKN